MLVGVYEGIQDGSCVMEGIADGNPDGLKEGIDDGMCDLEGIDDGVAVVGAGVADF